MLKTTHDINQQDLKIVALVLSKLNNFQTLEVVERTGETQLKVIENSN